MKFELSLRSNLCQLSALSVCFVMTSVQLNAQNITIPVETKSNAIVLQVDAKKNLNTIYFGKKLSSSAEYEEVPSVFKQSGEYTSVLSSPYTPSGSKSLMEPAISVTHADGNNSLDLRYLSHKVT